MQVEDAVCVDWWCSFCSEGFVDAEILDNDLMGRPKCPLCQGQVVDSISQKPPEISLDFITGPITFVFDVHGTLVDNPLLPNAEAFRLLKKLKDHFHRVLLWTGSTTDSISFGMQNLFDQAYPKGVMSLWHQLSGPVVYVDDDVTMLRAVPRYVSALGLKIELTIVNAADLSALVGGAQ